MQSGQPIMGQVICYGVLYARYVYCVHAEVKDGLQEREAAEEVACLAIVCMQRVHLGYSRGVV